PRVDDGLGAAVGAGGVHHVRGIAEQGDAPVHPGGHRVAVDHRVLVHLRGAAQHGRDVDPVVAPVFEVMQEVLVPHLLVPVAVAPSAGVVDGDFRDPVDV